MDGRALKRKLDFIDSYKAAKNASTGSLYDSNANVTQKNIATLQCELGKKDLIDVNRALMCRYIEKRYGPDMAKSYMNDLGKHVIYRNDESSVMPYTYSALEVVNVRYKGQELLVSLESLYDLADCEEVSLDDEEGVWAKYPKGMEIRDNGGYTPVERLIKKVRHRPLVRVKTQFGEDLVVTDNHPLIVSDDISQTVEASKAAGLRQFRPKYSLVWKNCREVDLTSLLDSSVRESAGDYFTSQTQETSSRVFLNYKKVALTDELGYLVGFFLGDGNFHQLSEDDGLHLVRDTIAISQNNKECLLRLAEIAAKYFMAPFAIYDVGRGEREAYRLVIKSDGLVAFLYDYLKLGTYAQNKSLPYNILETNKDFAKGIIWGLVDSDGSRNRHLFDIRLSSRTAINQLLWVMRDLGYNVGSRKQIMQFGFEGAKIQQKYPVWGVSFSITDPDRQGFPLSYKWQAYLDECAQTGKYKTFTKYHLGWETISEVTDIPESKFLEQNDFIYDITTESHSFVCNNLWVHNCASISLYPFLLHGLTTLGGSSKPPTHANSFIGGMINLIFMVSAQFAGAVAVPEFFTYFDHFLRIDYGEDYIEHLGDAVEKCNGREFTLKHKIEDWFQQFVYSINQPAGARNYQSPFVNVGYFDEYYFESVFEDFVFPDGDEPKWETTKELQKMFMKWFNKERERAVLTFPVESFSLLVDKETGKYKDEESAQFVSEMWAEGHSFFCYQSDSADALASCCFDGDTKVLCRSSVVGVFADTLKNIYEAKWEPLKTNFKVFHNGSWVAGKIIKASGRPMYRVTTANKKQFILTDNHINVTYDGEKPTNKLSVDDYLMFNTNPLQAVPEADEGLTYEQGFAVGAFLGDGSFGARFKDGTIYEIDYSLNEFKYEAAALNIDRANGQLGSATRCHLGKIINNVYPLSISSKKLASFIKRWTLWEEGTRANNKKLNLDVLLQSYDFRKGILDGWYATDGGNSNRCYTTSEDLKDGMEMLITSLGLNSIVDLSDRTDEKIIIRNTESIRNYPLWCVRWYEPRNKRSMEDVYKYKNNSMFFKITSIEKLPRQDDVYCVECKNQDEPYFTLPSGLITHNCRLRNAIEDNVFSYTLGAGAIQTGSKCVITMNVNHVVQDWDRDGRPCPLAERIAEVGGRIHRYLTAWNDKLWDDYEAGMLPVYKAGFIDLDKQYLTIGVNGFLEGAEFLGVSIDPDSPEYKGYAKDVLGTLKEINKEDRWRSGDGFEFDLNGRHYVMSADDRVRLAGGGFVKCSEWLKSPESYDVVGLDAFSPHEIGEISEISAKEE